MQIVESVTVFDKEGNPTKQIPLSIIFKSPIRLDLVHRIYVLMSSGWYQPQGRDPMAGKKTTAYSWGVDRAVSRVPRLSSGRARIAPGTVKGRLAHPPRSEKILIKKVNKKERTKAILSAISATAVQDIVKNRGHRLSQQALPLILDENVKKLTKTSEVKNMLMKLGFVDELLRLTDGTKKRSGKSAFRGRSKKTKVGPLFVVDSSCPLEKSATNITGIDVVNVSRLSLRELMPGNHLGRLTFWVESSIPIIERRLINKNVA